MRVLTKLAVPIVVATLFGAAFLASPPPTSAQEATATATTTSTATTTATATSTATGTATATATATGTATATPTATSTAVPSTGTILSGSVPTNGFGLIVWGGGTRAQLVTASACTADTLAFWVTAAGEFITYVPGTSVGAVNAAFDAMFPTSIPPITAMIARCR